MAKFNSVDLLKQMHLEEIFISPDFADFANWFAELTEENFVTESMISRFGSLLLHVDFPLTNVNFGRSNEMKSAGSFIYDQNLLNQKIEEIIGKSLHNVDEEMIEQLQEELDDLRDSKEALERMLSEASATESKLDTQLNRLDSEYHCLELEAESLMKNCKEDAQILETLRAKNIEDRNKLLSSFSSQQFPPLRWCRMDFENYFIDCDKIALSLKLRFENKFKLMNFDSTEKENLKRLFNLKNLQAVYESNAIAEFESENDLKKVNYLISIMKSPFEPMTYAAMSEKVQQLTWQNEEIEENIGRLEEAIYEKINYLAHQEAKLCEIENNKEKFKAAEKRLEVLKKIHRPIAENLLLSDTLWILLQMEMETVKSILEHISMAHYEQENGQCTTNMEILTNLLEKLGNDEGEQNFLRKAADIVNNDAELEEINSDNMIAKYKQTTIDSTVQLLHSVSDSYQANTFRLIDKFNEVSEQKRALIGDGPTSKPNIANLSVVADMEVYNRKFNLLFESSRTMRHDFMEKYHTPFVNDELWKRRQLLWIWFLTDEKEFLEAFEKTVNDAKHSGNRLTRMSMVGGLKRQQ
ncbi:Augmin complex subunit dgt3 [Pseudolycoriella hygida]|uniref:Augmin complex subunit dgt3 n=1 Tax=Pseudolycoriella hygida TaxID=35572 RepID=A0A9Q0S5Z2_9DIPT|nr:Augmin complex subunit dgt3 [Pseudolycoriella hygida]